MTYYHPTRAAAEEVANELQRDPRVHLSAVQMVPYNGWVVVLTPAKHDLSDLADRAEIQDGQKRPPPVGKVSPPRLRSEAVGGGKASEGGQGRPQGEGAPTAPQKGATARVWQIADSVGSTDRAKIIAACVEAGINPATAATQYSKWKKTKGL